MAAHGIVNPWDLTEFDKWVNDATRKDIETTAEQHNYEVFGLELWRDWKKIRGKNLVGALNFSVDLIFRNGDEAKVDKIVQEYEKTQSMETGKRLVASKKLVNQLFELALMSCTWV